MNLIARTFLYSLITLGVMLPVPAARAEMTELPKVRLRSLDKTTARTMTFDARVGTTIKFGSIYIKIQSCRKPDLQELPEAAAFLQVWEITPEDKSKWIFSGWMFASSPAVSAMDHPIYDVWVIDCLDDATRKAAEEQAAKDAEVKQDAPAEDAPATNTVAQPNAAPEKSGQPDPAPSSREETSTEPTDTAEPAAPGVPDNTPGVNEAEAPTNLTPAPTPQDAGDTPPSDDGDIPTGSEITPDQ